MKSKWLSVGIILLLIGTNIIPASAQETEKSQQASRGNWLYVGGSGPGNYTKIQDAIDNASDGDTVFVYDDSSPYIENIKIYKEINLLGEDKNSTEIECFDPDVGLIDITTADFITISGFTLSKSGNGYLSAGLQIYSSFNTISGNIFEDNEIGISLYTPCHSCKIYDNIFQNNINGIANQDSSFNDIYNNSFLSNTIGIVIFDGIENIIANNTFMNGDWGILLAGNSNKVVDNVIISNGARIEISDCSNNEIFRNNIRLSSHYGIRVPFKGENNKIKNNSLQQNWCGILIGWYYNLLEKNEIIDYWGCGIAVFGSNNEIHFNQIKDNKGVGIYITGSNNSISYNAIEKNTKGGVYLSGVSRFPGDCNYNKIMFNNFIKNNGFFLYSFKERRNKQNVWDNNYWDSLMGDVKIIIGRLKIVLYSWYMDKIRYEIAIYARGLNFDRNPTQEPYDIPGVK